MRFLVKTSTSMGRLIAICDRCRGFRSHCAESESWSATEADFRRAMKELSNWGRWGDDDELSAANLITPAKRKQALALAKEGRTVSLAHDVVQERAPDAANILERVVVTVSPTGSTDRYQYTTPAPTMG